MLGKTIKHFKDELSLYFDFDFLDCLNNTNSAKFYHTYLAEIKNEYSNLAPDKSSVIIKELSKEQLPVYKTISENWNPHLETVFGIISDNANPNYALSISEFIDKPSSLDYASLPKDKKITTRFLTLEQYINSFGCLSEKESLILIHQLCDALAVLHKNHMIHGDISPKNVLLTDKFNWDNEFKIFNGIHNQVSVKLIDFDISRNIQYSNHTVTHAVGTLNYAAPDILNFTNATDRIDIYSLGCLLYFMLTGCSPKDRNAPPLSKICSYTANHIFNTCTASYEIRYHNIHQLVKDIEKELSYPDKLFFNIIRKFPGFQTNYPPKNMIAFHLYAFVPISLIFDHSGTKTYIFSAIFVAVIYLFGCNLFYIGDRIPRYKYLCSIIPGLRYIIKISLILLIMLIISAIMFPQLR